MAVINRHLEAARLCLDAGADPNGFLPVHRHSVPLHQAALNDDVELMKLLVERGARLDIRDTLWDGTPLGWAVHNKKAKAEAYLRCAATRVSPDGKAGRDEPPVYANRSRDRAFAFSASTSRSRGGRVGLERRSSRRGGRGDLVDGALECRLVRLRRLVEAAQLAHELQRGGADLVLGRGRLEIEQRADVAAHRVVLIYIHRM